MDVYNTTIVSNTAEEGGGVYMFSCKQGDIHNTIIWDNSASSSGDQIHCHTYSASLDIANSLIEGGWAGAGNLSSDPRFVREPSAGADGAWRTPDDDFGDLRLLPSSPALDAGDSAATTSAGITEDSQGYRRVIGQAIDMGAYEDPLGMSKAVEPTGLVPRRATITYTVSVDNGTGITQTNAIITDPLDADLAFDAWIERPTGAQEASDVITWTGTLAPDAVLTLSFTAIHTGATSGPISNTAHYSGSVRNWRSTTFAIPLQVFLPQCIRAAP